MTRSTRSTCLTVLRTRKPGMYVVVGIVATLLLSNAWSAPKASAVSVAVAAAGDLDQTFGVGGKVFTNFSGDFDQANGIAIQPDGKIIAVGGVFSVGFTGLDFALARYNVDGSLDPTFGIGGQVTTDIGNSSGDANEAFAVIVQPDGRIVAAGSSGPDFAVVRYDNDGTLDSTFGTDGKAIARFINGTEGARGVALQTDGKIVAVGTVFGDEPNRGDFALVRFRADGNLDASFGSGVARLPLTSSASSMVYRQSQSCQMKGSSRRARHLTTTLPVILPLRDTMLTGASTPRLAPMEK